jgi:cytochrome c biogenesis factor
MLMKAFQIVLVVLVALFTLAGLTLLLGALQSTLIATAGIGSFTFAVGTRVFRTMILTLLLLTVAVFAWRKRRRKR